MAVAIRIGLTIIVATLVSACDPQSPVLTPCRDNVDCPGTLLCLDGVCGDPAGVACDDATPCPNGFLCLENGRCRANAECLENADCCADATSCDQVCENFQCIGSACTPGDVEDCFNGCHRGTRVCVNGNWGLCDALPVEPEVCGDGADNDCNGEEDDGCNVGCNPGDVQACDAPCGPGTQTCGDDGAFGPCDTAAGCACDPETDTTRVVECGACGFNDQSCGDDGFWAADDVCQGEGECVAGDIETVPCGACGVQTRFCLDGCVWGPFGACEVPADACVPGTVEELSCGTCGSQTRTCNDDCQFGAPTECIEGTGCVEGEIQRIPCGRCGERTATCDDQCTFGAFGACLNEGECTPGEIHVEDCGNCGRRERVCTDRCTFGPFGPCLDQGECTPGEQVTEACGPTTTTGICERGTRTKVCNNTCRFDAAGECQGAVFPSNEVCGNGIDENCNGNADDSLADQFEPNNSCATATLLGTDPDITIQATYDNSTLDVADYYFIHGVDNFGTAVEHIVIDLTNIPAGMDLDIRLYKGLNACNADTPLSGCGPNANQLCVSEAGGNSPEHIEWGEGFGVSDDADYFIRVKPFAGSTANCFQTYTLRVDGLSPL